MESPKEPSIITNGLNDEQLAHIDEKIESYTAQAAINIPNKPASMEDFFKEAEKKIKFTSEPGGVNVIYHEAMVKALRIQLDGLRRKIVMNEIVANQGS